MKFLLIFLVLGFDAGFVSGQTTNADGTETTALNTEMQNIAVEEVDNALFIDVGRYSTISFHYYNDMDAKDPMEEDHCIDQYFRCLLTTVALIPVCGFNQENTPTYNAPTYCDLYFDNCRRGFRVWRVVVYGKCLLIENYIHAENFWRRSYKNDMIVKLLIALARQPGRTGLSITKNNSNKAMFPLHYLGNYSPNISTRGSPNAWSPNAWNPHSWNYHTNTN